ncbi:MAG TPA: histidinol-phosphate transaminase [Candidatus Binataceae bacterium]|nr:histidinol-phosphate transaminase [Candidatus Binataceae bacterium]
MKGRNFDLLKPDDLVLPSVSAIHPYAPGKPVEELERELGIGEAVKLASNENPIGPSPRAVQAIRAALAELNRYPDGGCYQLRHKVAAHHQLTADHIFIGSGSVEIINLLAFLFLRPGLNAIFTRHGFAIYPLATASTGAEAKVIGVRPSYEFDLDAIANAIDDNTRIIYLDNPNNPTGTIYRRAEWKRFLARVPQRVVIVADEAYFEFVRDPEYPDSLEDHDGERMIVTLRTFSKIFGLAGVRVGYAVARPEIIRLLDKVRQPFNVTSLAQVAVLAAMDDREHIEATLKVNQQGMAYLEREFRRLGIPFVPSHANFILADVGDGAAVYDKLLRKGVIVRPMGGYALARHLRISVGLPEENRKLVEALEQVIRQA